MKKILDNSKQHSSNNNILSNHKSALNYFSLNQNNKNIKSIGTNSNNNSNSAINDKPPTLASNKAFKKIAGQLESAASPDKKLGNFNKNNYNSIKKEKKPLDNSNSMNQNQTHLHSNKNSAKVAEKYHENLEKSNKKLNLAKTSSYNSKDAASHSFQQNQNQNKAKSNENNLNISDNSQISANATNNNNNNSKGFENPNENNNNGQNLFDFTLLKSYNEKLFKQEKAPHYNDSSENVEHFVRENLKKELRDTPPKKRELAKSLPATTKNSNTLSFKSNLNEMALNNKAYNLLKTKREEETKEINYQGYLKANIPNPNVKVNDLLNEKFKNNSEKLVKCEKEKCEDCEIKLAELESIYDKVKVVFDVHKKKETNWIMEKNNYLKQIDYLNSVIKQFIEKTS